LYIQDIELYHFGSFYGSHVISLGEGLNYLGGGQEARCSLLDAVDFALTGSQLRKDKLSLINHKRRDEVVLGEDWLGTSVELVLDCEGRRLFLERDFMYITETCVKEGFTYSSVLPEITRATLDRQVILKVLPEENIEKQLIEAASLNRNQGPGFMILDGLQGSVKKNRKLVEMLEESGLQVIILSDDLESADGYVRLLVDLEHVNLRVSGFPFEKGELEYRLGVLLSHRYLTEGMVILHEHYGHTYSVEVLEAFPDGGRYHRDETEQTYSQN
jgi:hypothetical protein